MYEDHTCCFLVAAAQARGVMQMKGESKAAAELLALSQLINQVRSGAC